MLRIFFNDENGLSKCSNVAEHIEMSEIFGVYFSISNLMNLSLISGKLFFPISPSTGPI